MPGWMVGFPVYWSVNHAPNSVSFLGKLTKTCVGLVNSQRHDERSACDGAY